MPSSPLPAAANPAICSTPLAGNLCDYQLYIDGAFVPAQAGATLDSTDPVTCAVWAKVARADPSDVDRAVQAAHRAFHNPEWRGLSASARGALLRKLGDLIAQNADWLAQIEMKDNGKLIAELSVQMRYLPNYYYYYGGLADKVQGATIPTDKPGVLNYTRYEPMGVVACIMPWNSPLPLMAFKLAPALAAGNTVVLKPSEFTSASTLEFMKLVELAGFPKGVVNVVTGFGHEMGEALVTHPMVERIAFTGGPDAGRIIAEQAARSMKRVSLELGGKSPNIIFEDADLDQAVKGAVAGIFAASGQTCVAGSRLLLQRSIHDEVVQRLLAFLSDIRFGHPGDPDTQIAPISTAPQMRKIEDYVAIAQAEGAQLIRGGRRVEVSGYPDGLFYDPTIFTGVSNRMRIAQEEVFGPVLSIIPFEDEDDAVAIANDTIYGLAAGVWTRSLDRGVRMAERLRAGTVWVNNYRSTSVTSPFGGFGQSGIGREGGMTAILDYMELKSVWLSTNVEIPNPFIRR
ncbi:MAG: aldehyde dehydrogenase [Pararhodobacter sp.]|nr:aldehyde dehydrogenase [Pararhodobacter sp.]